MKLTICVWSSWTPGTWRATSPATHAAATVMNGVASRTVRLMTAPSETGAAGSMGSPVGSTGAETTGGAGTAGGAGTTGGAGTVGAVVVMANVTLDSSKL